MKYYECKPCEYFATKPNGKRKTMCNLREGGEKTLYSINKIVWCQVFEKRQRVRRDISR